MEVVEPENECVCSKRKPAVVKEARYRYREEGIPFVYRTLN